MKVYATMSGFVGHGGRSVDIHEGDEYDDSDPLVKALPQHFAPRRSDEVDDGKRRPARAR